MTNTSVWKRYLTKKFALIKEEAIQDTYTEIKDAAILNGYNLWIMAFAMLIACIGLNVDSTSAVIDAMLKSPLMGPIIGLAFGMAINDVPLKQYSLANWLVMTIICLIASTVYFLISPFDHSTNAVASFTKASIFDILIAFFGGMAGFIGIIKKEGTKVLAGVAVATACMPPLCTAGFGLAQGNWVVALGGLYFYLIICLFIGLAHSYLAGLLATTKHLTVPYNTAKRCNGFGHCLYL